MIILGRKNPKRPCVPRVTTERAKANTNKQNKISLKNKKAKNKMK